MTEKNTNKNRIDILYQKLQKESEESGYHLNPDTDHTRELIKGLVTSENRYGYWACPCRLATGNKKEDRDIICPCDYRDPDLTDHGTCYCALYVNEDVITGKKTPGSIPERRPPASLRKHSMSLPTTIDIPASLPYPIWRCRVCGYLCGRDNPPERCPICKAHKDRFEKFISQS
jgi:ferredoxin-thioredoxin reductase catalytic subunit